VGVEVRLWTDVDCYSFYVIKYPDQDFNPNRNTCFEESTYRSKLFLATQLEELPLIMDMVIYLIDN
ncbi:Secreted hypothetical protein, partial [Zostera marina]